MTPTHAAAVLRQLVDWRKGVDVDPPKPGEVFEAIDAAIAMIERLEATEKERDWNAERLEDAIEELTALRAKVEAMEKQEPVAWCATDETGTVIEALGMNQSRRFDTPLYLATGAQGEENRERTE